MIKNVKKQKLPPRDQRVLLRPANPKLQVPLRKTPQARLPYEGMIVKVTEYELELIKDGDCTWEPVEGGDKQEDEVKAPDKSTVEVADKKPDKKK